jgi:transcriptional antiterminator RfaH
MPAERFYKGSLTIVEEPLFPRYLFIRLEQSISSKSWSPIRSTKGVSSFVTFGIYPSKVNDSLIHFLQSQEAALRSNPSRLFRPGEIVRVVGSSFIGLEGVYEMDNGVDRAMVLIEILGKPVKIHTSLAHLQKINL